MGGNGGTVVSAVAGSGSVAGSGGRFGEVVEGKEGTVVSASAGSDFIAREVRLASRAARRARMSCCRWSRLLYLWFCSSRSSFPISLNSVFVIGPKPTGLFLERAKLRTATYSGSGS